MTTEKGSDLEVVDTKKMTVSGEGEWLFSEAIDHMERSLQPKSRQTGGQRNRQADIPAGVSLHFLCFPYLSLFVSSSALRSEQAFQGHLAGCKTWA